MNIRVKKPEENRRKRNLLLEIEREHQIRLKGFFDKVIIYSAKNDMKVELNHHMNCRKMRESGNAKVIHRNRNNLLNIHNELNYSSHWKSINDAHLKRNMSLPKIIDQMKKNPPRNQRENSGSAVIGTKLSI